MAQKRMFTMKIVDSDAFLDMPLSSQCLYFHLNMRADDDGFVGNPKKIMRMIGASDDDFKILLAKKFLLIFENNVIVIKHWWMNNTLRKDCYHETSYVDEKKILKIKDNKAYTLSDDGNSIKNVNEMLTEPQQKVNPVLVSVLDKVSVSEQESEQEKVLEEEQEKETGDRQTNASVVFSAPTPFDVFTFYKEYELSISPERFWRYNNKKGWIDKHGIKIKNWKNAYLEMCNSYTPDETEAFDPLLLFNPDKYDRYTGNS